MNYWVFIDFQLFLVICIFQGATCILPIITDYIIGEYDIVIERANVICAHSVFFVIRFELDSLGQIPFPDPLCNDSAAVHLLFVGVQIAVSWQ